MKTQNENKKKFELKLSNQDLELKKKKEMIEESIQSGQLIVTNEKVDPKKKKKKK
jgi:hypothetical protein